MTTPFVIAGCGRSGSTYTARLLCELGIPTSHEEFFVASRLPHDIPKYPAWLSWTGVNGEVSGLSPPFLGYLHSDIRVIHLVRNPMAVVSSLMSLENLHAHMHQSENIKFNFRHLPQMHRLDDPLTLCLKYWLHWNTLVDIYSPMSVWQSERLQTALYVHDVVHTDLGIDIPVDRCEECMHIARFSSNSGPRTQTIQWAHIPLGPLKDEVLKAANRYGYTVADLLHYPG